MATKIPNYIQKDIQQISKYADKMAPLISQVEDWYDKQLKKYEDILDEIDDEDLCYISHNENDLKEFSLSSLIHNLKLLEETSSMQES